MKAEPAFFCQCGKKKQNSMSAEWELLVGGQQAFPVILEEIRRACQSIYINMFIWRNDSIGKKLAQTLLEAADRGVKVQIVKDRYGILCEYSEEDQSSFFHKDPGAWETVEAIAMKAMYQPGILLKPFSRGDGVLLVRMQAHPNIRIQSGTYRRDHSKFYIIDERIVILGGINVEDKENGADRQGHRYLDYMVRVDSTEAVQALRRALDGEPGSGEGMFGLNLPGRPECFGIRRRYTEMIDAAQGSLSIVMAYIMPLNDIMQALERALDRGVKLRLLIPAKANYLNASNRASALQLYDYARKHGARAEIYLAGVMTHIKALVSDQTIAIGSANMTGKAFVQLGEMNIFVPNDGGTFARSVQESFQTLFDSAERVTDRRQLRHGKLPLFLEKCTMSR